MPKPDQSAARFWNTSLGRVGPWNRPMIGENVWARPGDFHETGLAVGVAPCL